MKRFFYDYSRPLRKVEVLVHLLNLDDHSEYEKISNGIQHASEKFGFTYEPISDINEGKILLGEQIVRLLIIVSDKPFTRSVAEFGLTALHTYTAVSIAFNYSSLAEMLSHEEMINLYKRLSNDRINFLRPVQQEDNTYVVGHEKIVDNSICDSVRVKYKAECLDNSPVQLSAPIRKYFENCAAAYRDYVLYHRSPSDGYFAVRVPDTDRFYVTSTKTYKDNLNIERIAEVVSYDPSKNLLKYRGKFMPSSDSVEAAIVFKDMPEVNSLLHTHASKQFTRNPQFSHKIKMPIASYGEYETGLMLRDALKNESDGFIIMEDHGEVFSCTEFNVPATVFKNLDIYRQLNRKSVSV
ncbi:hypothetical protein AB9P05_19690 [Roseivirga sp. BDSF3-8]|uniref:hypothetical protein n=1 Tax=Roseivirga sp. BDSF3-8 TaxID=3241598 RepID=UPI003531A219